MSSKAILILCAQAFLIQAVFSQCTSRAAVDASGIAAPFGYAGPGLNAPFGRALAYDGLASPYAYDGLAGWAGRGLACDGIYPAMAATMDFTPTSGGGLPVTSSSINAPTGISIMSENAYEGILSVAGELPFVGTTALEGVVPSAGAGAINHACGNGINAMSALSATSSPASVLTSEIIAPYGMAAPGFAGIGYAAPALGATAWAAPGLAAPAMAYEGLLIEAPFEGIEFTATSGGALPVSSASPVPPVGISVASETAYEGPLAVVGELPFVGTVAVDGVVPSAGAGAVNHACGNGINAMVSETTAFGPGYAGAYGPASAFAPASGFRYPAGWAGRSCGYAI